jgi:hypothetical protein
VGGYRRRRRRRRGPGYKRGGGVYVGRNPYGAGSINIMDGGRDAPAGPMSPRAQIIAWTLLAVTVVVTAALMLVYFT